MAQVFQLPIGFQYFRRKVRWHLDEAVVTDWVKHQDGTPDTDHLQMRVRGSDGLMLRVQSTELPEDLYNHLWDHPDSDPAGICCGWRVPVFWFESGFAEMKIADAWEMRGEFLKLKPVPSEILNFLNSWGPWISSDRLSQNYFRHARLDEIIKSHKGWIKALASPPEQWFPFAGWPFWLTVRKGFPPFWVSTEGCQAAIDTTITIDFLRGVRFSVCQRPDCNGEKYFACSSGHLRKYCSWYCGHIESVRRGREAQRFKTRKKKR
jgi:hypothetical protein